MKPTCCNAKPEGSKARRLPVALWEDTIGAVALEYGLIAALIAVVLIASLRELGATLLGLPLQSIIDAIKGVLS